MPSATVGFLIPGVPAQPYADNTELLCISGLWTPTASQPVGPAATPSWVRITINPGSGAAPILNDNTSGIALQARAGSNLRGAAYVFAEADGANRGVLSITPTTRNLRYERATGSAGSESYSTVWVCDATGIILTDSAEVGAAGFVYWGDKNTNGSWRQGRSGNDLVMQRRESGSWVTKQTIAA